MLVSYACSKRPNPIQAHRHTVTVTRPLFLPHPIKLPRLCMHACMHVCVYVCVYVCVCVCANNVHAYMRVVRACVFARVLGFVHARVYMCVCVCILMYVAHACV